VPDWAPADAVNLNCRQGSLSYPSGFARNLLESTEQIELQKEAYERLVRTVLGSPPSSGLLAMQSYGPRPQELLHLLASENDAKTRFTWEDQRKELEPSFSLKTPENIHP
jgi:hypothetical protein